MAAAARAATEAVTDAEEAAKVEAELMRGEIEEMRRQLQAQQARSLEQQLAYENQVRDIEAAHERCIEEQAARQKGIAVASASEAAAVVSAAASAVDAAVNEAERLLTVLTRLTIKETQDGVRLSHCNAELQQTRMELQAAKDDQIRQDEKSQSSLESTLRSVLSAQARTQDEHDRLVRRSKSVDLSPLIRLLNTNVYLQIKTLKTQNRKTLQDNHTRQRQELALRDQRVSALERSIRHISAGRAVAAAAAAEADSRRSQAAIDWENERMDWAAQKLQLQS